MSNLFVARVNVCCYVHKLRLLPRNVLEQILKVAWPPNQQIGVFSENALKINMEVYKKIQLLIKSLCIYQRSYDLALF